MSSCVSAPATATRRPCTSRATRGATTRPALMCFPDADAPRPVVRRRGASRGDRRGVLRARSVPPARRGPDRRLIRRARADRAAVGPSTARACTSTDRSGSRPAASSPTSPPGTSCRPGRCWCATAARLSTATIARASPAGRRSSTPTSRSGAIRAVRSGCRTTSCWPCAATGAGRASTPASSWQSSRVCCCRSGARDAINLDGGGSATLVHRGHLLNRPYSNEDQPAPESRPVVTALLFEPA